MAEKPGLQVTTNDAAKTFITCSDSAEDLPGVAEPAPDAAEPTIFPEEEQ